MSFNQRFILLLLMIFSLSLKADTLEKKMIKTAIADKYLEIYPSLAISSLTIKPLGKMPKKFNDYHIDTIYLSQASLKRNHGTFSVLYANSKKKKKRFFKFNLDATIGVYYSQRYLKRDQAINTHYVSYQEIPFKSFPSLPINEQHFYDYESKRSIKEGKIITVNDIRRILDIKRDTIIDATLYDGAVELTFKVKTIEEGNIGDIIKVKRGHYKKFKAQITSKSSVDIIE